MKNLFFSYSQILFLLVICSSAKSPTYQLYQFNYENVLGTSFELKVKATSENAADLAQQIALEEIDRLNSILSTYRPDSEISCWLLTQRTEEKISSELFEVFSLFDQWKSRTNGALSASAAVGINLWKVAAARQQLPDTKDLNRAIELMKQPQWSINPQHQTATHLSNQSLALNSFVKSYVINKVSEKIMNIPEVSGAVINIGGDIIVIGDQKEKIYVADPLADAENDAPLASLNLQNKAIATSGNYRRGFQVGSQWFSHILDVRTALPASETISVTVVANDATDAGALATASNILSPAECAELAAKVPDVEYLIILKTGEKISSEGWMDLASKSIGPNSGGVLNKIDDHFEVSIEFELARFEGRSHRPFVAVWLENKKKEPVRTVSVWFNKTRWLPDLKKWFNKNQSFTQDYSSMGSISSATRSAGKYSLVWDGLDDAGKIVPSGKYTIYIEAAREHGTYQLIRQDIDWNGKPNHFDLGGGVEITSASIDLHIKTGN